MEEKIKAKPFNLDNLNRYLQEIDGDRSDKADKEDVKYHCTVDTYDGRCWYYCFSEIYNYIESNNLWEVMIKKHRIKNF